MQTHRLIAALIELAEELDKAHDMDTHWVQSQSLILREAIAVIQKHNDNTPTDR